jgi:hypothetical protein
LNICRRLIADRFLFVGVCSLFCFVAFVPHRYVYSYDSGIVGQLINWVPVLPVGVCFGLLLCAVLAHRKKPIPLQASVHIAIVVWIGLTMVSGLGSELPGYALQRDIYYALTGVLMIFVARRAFAERHLLGVNVLVAPAALIGALCIYEFAVDTHPFWAGVFSSENVRYVQFAHDDFGRRVLGTVGHPVYLGAFLVLILPLALWIFFQAKGTRRVVAGVVVVGVFAGLLLTFSRGAWLGAAIGGLIYLRRRSSRQLWAAALAGCLLLALAFSIDRVWSTLESRGTIGQIQRFATDQRGIAYRQATAILAAQPLLGVGTGLYRFAGGRVGDWNDTPDNMYLRLLAEHGIAGLAAAIVLFAATINVIHVARRSLSARGCVREADLCLAVIAGLAGFLVDMITCDALYFPLTRVSFWIVSGLGLAVAGQADDLGVAS